MRPAHRCNALVLALCIAGGCGGEGFSEGTGADAGTAGAGGSDAGKGGGAGEAGGAGSPGCAPGGTTDCGFENSLVTALGTWQDLSTAGMITHVKDYRQAGSYALRMGHDTTAHFASNAPSVRVQLDLTKKKVSALRVYNIAIRNTSNPQSWWSVAWSAISLSDGTNSDNRFTMYYRPYAETTQDDQNDKTATGTETGADGRTWFYYDIAIPVQWNHETIKLSLSAGADGGDQGAQMSVASYWDVVVIPP
jgi:hypothetical protein